MAAFASTAFVTTAFSTSAFAFDTVAEEVPGVRGGGLGGGAGAGGFSPFLQKVNKERINQLRREEEEFMGVMQAFVEMKRRLQ